jgi:hypothetical protein
MKLYREWCKRPDSRKGCMLPESQINLLLKSADPGYASVYAFDEDAAKSLIESKSSAGMSRFPVYTRSLIMDLDNGPEQLALAEAKLADLGLGYEVWFSGSKGYHIYIEQDALCSGRNVPYSQRLWVEGIQVGADLSLYQHGRILSLPGRIHAKTGKRKEKVKDVSGSLLTLELKDPPQGVSFDFKPSGGMGELEAGLWKAIQALASEPAPGNRHTRLWSTALHFADAGVSYEATLELMHKVNEQWQAQKTIAEVEAAVSQAFKRK